MAVMFLAWIFLSVFVLRSEAFKDVNAMNVKELTNALLPALGALSSNFTCPLYLISVQYQEMACPILSLRNESFLYCPKEYDCSVALKRPDDKCIYKNKTYEIGSAIPDKLLKVRCKSNCVCTLDKYGQAGFVCKTQECPPPTGGCRQQYKDHLQCCPVENCGERTKKQRNCKYFNKWYTYGEVLFNNYFQKRCLCQKGFKGTLKGKWCKPVECGIELDSQQTVRQGCSPVFNINSTGVNLLVDGMKNDPSVSNLSPIELMVKMFDTMTSQLYSVCPSSWVCPSDNDVLVPALSLVSTLPDLDPSTTCMFGYNEMTLMDILMTPELEDGSCSMCLCLMPPMLSCIVKYPCWTF